MQRYYAGHHIRACISFCRVLFENWSPTQVNPAIGLCWINWYRYSLWDGGPLPSSLGDASLPSLPPKDLSFPGYYPVLFFSLFWFEFWFDWVFFLFFSGHFPVVLFSRSYSFNNMPNKKTTQIQNENSKWISLVRTRGVHFVKTFVMALEN